MWAEKVTAIRIEKYGELLPCSKATLFNSLILLNDRVSQYGFPLLLYQTSITSNLFATSQCLIFIAFKKIFPRPLFLDSGQCISSKEEEEEDEDSEGSPLTTYTFLYFWSCLRLDLKVGQGDMGSAILGEGPCRTQVVLVPASGKGERLLDEFPI